MISTPFPSSANSSHQLNNLKPISPKSKAISSKACCRGINSISRARRSQTPPSNWNLNQLDEETASKGVRGSGGISTEGEQLLVFGKWEVERGVHPHEEVDDQSGEKIIYRYPRIRFHHPRLLQKQVPQANLQTRNLSKKTRRR